MKKTITAILLLVVLSIKAQIPNPGFETITNNVPAMWNTGPTYSYYTIKDTSVAKTGNHAGLIYGYVPPASGAIVQDFPNVSPVLPIGLTGWYKFYPELGDSILFDVWVWKQGGLVNAGKNNKLGTAITNSTSVYTQFNIPINYSTPLVGCDSAWISIYPSGNVVAFGYNWPHPNTIVMIDDLQWAYNTTNIAAVKENVVIEQVYPNPTNNLLNIVYTVPYKSKVSIKLIDTKGSLVETLLENEIQTNGRYKVELNTSKIPAGMYIVEYINNNDKTHTTIVVK